MCESKEDKMEALIPEMYARHFLKMLVAQDIFRFHLIETVQRTWKERLFTWPWRPWIKYKNQWKEIEPLDSPTDTIYIARTQTEAEKILERIKPNE